MLDFSGEVMTMFPYKPLHMETSMLSDLQKPSSHHLCADLYVI